MMSIIYTKENFQSRNNAEFLQKSLKFFESFVFMKKRTKNDRWRFLFLLKLKL
ncbi:hypothetical protein B14911_07318 [Bacillus sp. NRRL B-14911]|nr:hypothetical protein B14911_07318 [Bacillus sp. NRRL B-14911]